MKLYNFEDAMPLLCVSALPFIGARRTARLQWDHVADCDHGAVHSFSDARASIVARPPKSITGFVQDLASSL